MRLACLRGGCTILYARQSCGVVPTKLRVSDKEHLRRAIYNAFGLTETRSVDSDTTPLALKSNRAEKIPIVLWPSKPKRAFACWFHTHFVEHGRLRLAKCELDKACKDKKVSSDLRVAIKFHRVTGPRTWRPPPRSKRAPSPNNVVP